MTQVTLSGNQRTLNYFLISLGKIFKCEIQGHFPRHNGIKTCKRSLTITKHQPSHNIITNKCKLNKNLMKSIQSLSNIGTSVNVCQNYSTIRRLLAHVGSEVELKGSFLSLETTTDKAMQTQCALFTCLFWRCWMWWMKNNFCTINICIYIYL